MPMRKHSYLPVCARPSNSCRSQVPHGGWYNMHDVWRKLKSNVYNTLVAGLRTHIITSQGDEYEEKGDSSAVGLRAARTR